MSRRRQLVAAFGGSALALAGGAVAYGTARTVAANAATGTATTLTTVTTTATTTATTPVILTPDEKSRTVPFGLGRTPKTITLTYSAASALASDTAIDVVLNDLSGANDVFPANQISTAVALVGSGTIVKVTATFDPQGVKSGSYSGQLRLAGPAVTARPVSLSAELDERSGWGYAGAFLVILIGVFVGLITKWLSDTGVKLGALRARVGDLSFDLAALRPETLPPGYLVDVERVRRMLDRGDAAGASPLVDQLTAAEEAVSALSRRLSLLEDVLKEQRNAIATAGGVDDATRRQLTDVVDGQVKGLTEIAVAAWPDPGASDAELQLKSKWINAYAQFLHQYVNADPVARSQPPLKTACDAFVGGQFDAAINALAQGAPTTSLATAPAAFKALDALVAVDDHAATQARAVPDDAGGAPKSPPALHSLAYYLAMARSALADNAGLFTALLFGLLVALVGLTELYSNKPTAGQSIADWVGFFAWGFAIELTGITTAQAALRLAPAKS
jgi:hypothetical protein